MIGYSRKYKPLLTIVTYIDIYVHICMNRRKKKRGTSMSAVCDDVGS